MINHCRTLLLNRDGLKRPGPSYFLEALVDPDFHPLLLSPGLQQLHDILLGVNSDNAFANYRLWQLMKILHSTEFVSYVLALDSRVTYTSMNPPVRLNSATFTGLNLESAGSVILFVGAPVVTKQSPIILRNWQVTLKDANTVTLANWQDGSTVDVPITFDGGMTNTIPMPGQPNFSIRISAQSLSVGASWMIETFAEPSGDLTDLLDPLTRYVLSHPEIFMPNQTPFTVFRQLWSNEVFLPYRLSGLLLAFIYQLEKVRTGG